MSAKAPVPKVDPSVLLGLRNPANMPRLLETGRLLAEELGGGLQPFCVVGAQEGQSSFAGRLLQVADRACAEVDVAAPLRIESRSFQEGIVDVTRARRPSHLLLGYSPHREEDLAGERAFTQALRLVFRQCQAHLIVAHFGEPRELHRVLVPLACDENLAPIGHLARGLLRAPECEVTLAHVLPEAASLANHHAASAFLRQIAERCGILPQAAFRVETHEDPAEGILEMSWEYDAIIVGMPRTRKLAQRLFGSVADQVASWARCTTFLVRACP